MKTLNNVVLFVVVLFVAFGSVPVSAAGGGILERVNRPAGEDGIMDDAVRLAMGTAAATTMAQSSSSRSCGGCEAAMRSLRGRERKGMGSLITSTARQQRGTDTEETILDIVSHVQ